MPRSRWSRGGLGMQLLPVAVVGRVDAVTAGIRYLVWLVLMQFPMPQTGLRHLLLGRTLPGAAIYCHVSGAAGRYAAIRFGEPHQHGVV